MERLEEEVKRLNERLEEMHEEQAALMAERTEGSRQSLAQVEAHRVMLARAQESEQKAWERAEKLDEALEFAEWTVGGGNDPMAAWLPNGWCAWALTEEEAKKGEVPGTMFYQKVATDECPNTKGTWDHPCPQLWDDVWQVAYGTGDRPPAYEKYCRRYEDDPDEL